MCVYIRIDCQIPETFHLCLSVHPKKREIQQEVPGLNTILADKEKTYFREKTTHIL